jgi:hypothetical protein
MIVFIIYARKKINLNKKKICSRLIGE